MKKVLIVVVAGCAAADAFAQNCLVPAPPAPPQPTELIVKLPLDGGTQGCTAWATVPGGQQPGLYVLGPAKCANAVGMAKQAASNDNGWNDGGTP